MSKLWNLPFKNVMIHLRAREPQNYQTKLDKQIAVGGEGEGGVFKCPMHVNAMDCHGLQPGMS